jgi:tryptophan 2,3-dioxygenase
MAFGLAHSELSYGSYLKLPQLTELQTLLSDPPQHDELLFIVIHQVYELWFKQLLHELDAVTARLEADEPLGAQRLLMRCIEIERVLIAQLKVLETMTPNDFLTFRDRLMPASGFQSAQFRCIEAVCGVPSERHLESFAADSPEHAMLRARIEGPKIVDGFYALLRRRGFDLPESLPANGRGSSPRTGTDASSNDPSHDPSDASSNDPSDASSHEHTDASRANAQTSPPGADPARERRIRELARIYQSPDDHYSLFLLAEALVEFDEMFTLWRIHHVQMVERMIGAKPGTGGSEGVGYLRRTLGQKFFPELWELRSVLGKQG